MLLKKVTINKLKLFEKVMLLMTNLKIFNKFVIILKNFLSR